MLCVANIRHILSSCQTILSLPPTILLLQSNHSLMAAKHSLIAQIILPLAPNILLWHIAPQKFSGDHSVFSPKLSLIVQCAIILRMFAPSMRCNWLEVEINIGLMKSLNYNTTSLCFQRLGGQQGNVLHL